MSHPNFLANQMCPYRFSSSSSSSEDEEVYERQRRIRIFRSRIDHFVEWDDIDFHIRFRLSKRTVNSLLDLIRHKIQHPTNRNKALQPETMLLLTIRYFASGGMLVSVGDFSGVHRSTAGKHVWRVMRAIAELKSTYVCLQNDREKMAELQAGFFEIARFPKVIGAIDCTHVRIASPGGDNAEAFRNRKGFFSVNVQAVCGPDLKINNVVARWPGSVHDSRIFENSKLKNDLEHGRYPGGILLGDSGYALKPYLITPILNVNNETENIFNESQIRTRNPVERCFGVWKRRFPVLSLGIRLGLDKVQGIIMATAVLHNIAIGQNEIEPPPLSPEILSAITYVNGVENARVTRAEISNHRLPLLSYFANLPRISQDSERI